MMYLVVRTCNDDAPRSCGCLQAETPRTSNDNLDEHDKPPTHDYIYSKTSLQWDLGLSELSELNAGRPLRLTKSVLKQQGNLITLSPSFLSPITSLTNPNSECSSNYAFASAFTQVFMDSSDLIAINLASEILNGARPQTRFVSSKGRRLKTSNYRDLAYIEWARSALNIHNNHIGRQVSNLVRFKR